MLYHNEIILSRGEGVFNQNNGIFKGGIQNSNYFSTPRF